MPSALVDVAVQPVFEWQQVTPLDVGFQCGDVLTRLLKKHGRIEVPQGIRGKVAQGPQGPMDVLQHAVGVPFGSDPQIFPHLFPPQTGQVPDFNLFFNQGQFDVKTHHDVQVVRDFVRFHPDQGGLYPVQGGMEAIR